MEWHSSLPPAVWHNRRTLSRSQPVSHTSPLHSTPTYLQAMGEYIKSKGLKYGIYSDAGTLTCAKYPGSLGYEKEDAQTFADWGGYWGAPAERWERWSGGG